MKKTVIIVSAIIIVAIASICVFIITNKDSDKDLKAPATNTEKLLESMEEIKVTAVETDKIEFAEEVKVKAGEKVAVWVYSKPKFLGYFDVVEENGVKMIKGLKEKLESLDIEPGEHNIALTTEKGESIGYIDINIKEDGNMIEREEIPAGPVITTKEEVVEEKISFKTTKQNDASMKKGTEKVIQEGVNGTKEITYKITYEDGKEVSKEKVSEKVTKEAVNKIVKVGAADFNLKTDKLKGELIGNVCTENQLIDNSAGEKECNDMLGLKFFTAIKINDTYYAICFNSDDCHNDKVNSFIKLTKQEGMLFTGKYNGKQYYFDGRGGRGDDTPLTSEICKKYKLSCGSW